MSLPLKDFRPGITESIHAALEAESIAFGKDMQTVAREILQNWADGRHRAYKIYARRVLANGLQVDLPGFEMEDAGPKRKGR